MGCAKPSPFHITGRPLVKVGRNPSYLWTAFDNGRCPLFIVRVPAFLTVASIKKPLQCFGRVASHPKKQTRFFGVFDPVRAVILREGLQQLSGRRSDPAGW